MLFTSTNANVIAVLTAGFSFVGFVVGVLVRRSLDGGAGSAALGACCAMPIVLIVIRGHVRENLPHRPMVEDPPWRLHATAASLLAVAVIVAGTILLPSAGSAGTGAATNPTSTPPSLTASRTPARDPSADGAPESQRPPMTAPTSITHTPTPSARGTTTTPAGSVSVAAGWPTTANDGSPAMWVYFGSEFFLPDWVSCEQTYCLAGSGAKIYVYTQHPIDRKLSFNADVPDPYAKLISLGFTAVQARALLKQD